jgi:hypothetical protein
MNEEYDQHRYLFLVRQRFGEIPELDSFYELSVPSGTTQDHARVMVKLDKDWCKEQITSDTQALSGMQLRQRFNTDMYPSVCLVRTTCEIEREDLNHIIAEKHRLGELMAFLDESAIK